MLNLRTTVLGATLVLVSASSIAQATAGSAATPELDQRQANQDKRIDQGVASGVLTQSEAARIGTKQDAIERTEDKAKADGVVTHRERKHLAKMQNHSSRAIHRQKHDAQQKP